MEGGSEVSIWLVEGRNWLDHVFVFLLEAKSQWEKYKTKTQQIRTAMTLLYRHFWLRQSEAPHGKKRLLGFIPAVFS